ncbi:TPA: nucleoid-associated protein [Vibrio diabolicus]|uniref:nucleoid-associated protein n=1 Tax=Vibrio TaxID=662 RepID=UPI001A8F4CE1|nr:MULTISPECIES: nucleoid-associated protein [Vibrio]EIL2908410.1 nucleoid-associated protein [Vibrio alginolyticus]MBO0162577.1 nucleoid-associated protein [Vibrio alginolyticus]MCS0183906.1 nucleoid-associated protein [Vibrio alginolyticus]MDW1954903.1 nucleoid-associated protein [Vibrio sp. Vb0562]
MQLINLQIKRIAIHQIYQRDENGDKVTPTKSSDLIKFAPAAMDTFKSRVIDALGASSQAVPMTILDQGDNALAPIVDKLNNSNDSTFIDLSYKIADKLADAQQRKGLPGGIVVVFEGKFGASPKNFVGIMKAEIHSAYEKETDKATQEITLKYVEEALLTPATKLYKTAGFFETGVASDNLSEKWQVLVCDTQISKSDGKAAAHYFYSSFLGCGYPITSARTTKQYYEATSEFISDMDVSAEKRNDLQNALVTYLKHDTSDVVNPTDFANRFFNDEEKDSYSEYLEDKNLPTTSFTKDIEHISNKLKTRKLSFSKNVKITAPSSVFKDLIEIESIDNDAEGQPVKWTKVTIKDQIISQE